MFPTASPGWDDSNEVCGCLNRLNPNEGIETHIFNMLYWMSQIWCDVCDVGTFLVVQWQDWFVYVLYISTDIHKHTQTLIILEARCVFFQNLQVDLLQKDTMHQHIQRVHAQAVRRKFCAAYDAAWSWMDGTTIVVFQKLESFMLPAREFVIYYIYV